ncbi:MAG: hypothetical protein GXP29_01970 [Planctomycetes bacterium]|nr:hypothetical protein [Planctomycetota bacterium]
MNIITQLFDAIGDLLRRSESVRAHRKRQAHGPRWSRHRSRRIEPYRRRRTRSKRN